jgi:hypothetical protein
MIQQGMDLKDMDITELKARAYDLIALGENVQRQLQETNILIQQKSRPEPIKEE